MEGPLLALELRAQTLAENGNKKAQMDGQVRALVLIWVGQIKAQMGLLSLKKRAKPTKDNPKKKEGPKGGLQIYKFKYILILYNIIQSNFSNIS